MLTRDHILELQKIRGLSDKCLHQLCALALKGLAADKFIDSIERQNNDGGVSISFLMDAVEQYRKESR